MRSIAKKLINLLEERSRSSGSSENWRLSRESYARRSRSSDKFIEFRPRPDSRLLVRSDDLNLPPCDRPHEVNMSTEKSSGGWGSNISFRSSPFFCPSIKNLCYEEPVATWFAKLYSRFGITIFSLFELFGEVQAPAAVSLWNLVVLNSIQTQKHARTRCNLCDDIRAKLFSKYEVNLQPLVPPK